MSDKIDTVETILLVLVLLFGIANIRLYVYVKKYVNAQTMIGLLGTAVLDFLIVFVIYKKRRVVSV